MPIFCGAGKADVMCERFKFMFKLMFEFMQKDQEKGARLVPPNG